MSLASFIRVAHEEVGNGPAKYLEMFSAAPGTKWCAMFVSWCAAAAGIMTIADSAGCPYIRKTEKVEEMELLYTQLPLAYPHRRPEGQNRADRPGHPGRPRSVPGLQPCRPLR